MLQNLVDPAFDITEPAEIAVPVIFNSPHSGRHYPEAFLDASRLDALTLRRSEDAFVDELFAGVVERGALLMRAHFPRAFLDVNREPYELDPRMFSGPLPPYANTRSVRVAGGLGTIARIVADSEEIYARPLSVAEAINRIDCYHKPYHRALKEQILRVKACFGFALLVDCHSMPSSIKGLGEHAHADFIIGDRYGTSCSRCISEVAGDCLTQLGYCVLRNRPYAGGYITEQYGNPVQGEHAIQIEINRALYLDELRCEKTRGFHRLAADLMRLAEDLMRLSLGGLPQRVSAAE